MERGKHSTIGKEEKRSLTDITTNRNFSEKDITDMNISRLLIINKKLLPHYLTENLIVFSLVKCNPNLKVINNARNNTRHSLYYF